MLFKKCKVFFEGTGVLDCPSSALGYSPLARIRTLYGACRAVACCRRKNDINNKAAGDKPPPYGKMLRKRYFLRFATRFRTPTVLIRCCFSKNQDVLFQIFQFKKLIRFKIENIHIFNVFVCFSFYQMQHAYFFV